MERFLLKKAPRPPTLITAEASLPSNSISPSLEESDEDSDSENTESTETSKSPVASTSSQLLGKRKRYKQNFKENWRKQFKWATEGKNGCTICIVCNIAIRGSVTHLKRHDESTSHQKRFKAAAQTPSVQKSFNKPSQQSADLVREAELKIVTFLSEHNLPFSLLDHFSLFCASAFPDSKIAKKLTMKRKKGTQIATNIIGPDNKQNVALDLQNNYFSLIIDETTDISISKCLVMVARYYKNNIVLDRFLDLIELESSSAQSIFNNIKIWFESNKIPLTNVIGLGSDNCSVMMGNLHGVKALFKEINPHIITIGCSCHSMHLCASYAGAKLPRSIEQFARNIYNYFQNSNKRLSELKECQIFVNEKPHTMLRLSQTRWLSLQAVINRIIEHWRSLELFFTRAALEDNLQRAELLLDSLRNPIYKVYFYFLSYVLDIINKINLEFQAETPKIQVLLDRISSLYKLILKSFLKKSYLEKTDLNHVNVSDPHNYLPIEELYCGAKVEVFFKDNEVDPTETKNFKLRALEYYIELSKQIKKRFNFDDEILNFASKFNPQKVILGTFNTISETEHFFPYLQLDIEKLDLEYRLLSEINELKSYADNMLEFWSNVANMNNELNDKMFPNVSKIAKIVMSLPHSSATAERVFSQLNLVKSKTRNKLLVKTCAGLLHIRDMLKTEGKSCFNWQPSRKMLGFSNSLLQSCDVLEEDIILN